ncbi:hypothetical protein ACSYAD_09020 [Acaryochloris marina NIES-2412]|uniref:hypothetical protein n=1 Tax=Acaryochloris marina TaxID=155978 RepID=UPI004057DCCD
MADKDAQSSLILCQEWSEDRWNGALQVRSHQQYVTSGHSYRQRLWIKAACLPVSTNQDTTPDSYSHLITDRIADQNTLRRTM